MQDRSLNDIKDMPKINPVLLKELGNSLWNQEMDYDVAEETLRHDKQYNLLNAEQRAIYESVLESVDKKEGKLFFVYGAGGTGKTFLYQTIISRLRSRKQIVLPVASSGIAALLLPNGRTAHPRFNIPLKLDEDKLCNIKPGTMLAELIEETDLIIWDEAPMTHKHAFEALDKTLKDIMSMKNPPAKNQPFGGKTGFVDPLEGVVDAAYGEINKPMDSQTSYTDKAILTPRNETVDEINAYTISRTDGVSRDYFRQF
ncbi:hypothetical protein YC2023_077011 [Brassica napus]